MAWSAVGTWHGSNNANLALSNQAIGDLLVVEVINFSNSTVWCTGLTGGGATWVQAGVKFSGSVNAFSAAVFLGTVTATGAQTATPTWSGTAPAAWGMAGQEFSSTAGAWVFDKQGTQDGTGTNTWPSLTPAFGAGELYFGYLAGLTATAGTTTGYVYNANVDNVNNGAAYNASCPDAATFPTWGDFGQQFGIVILVAEAGVGQQLPQRPRWHRRDLRRRRQQQQPPAPPPIDVPVTVITGTVLRQRPARLLVALTGRRVVRPGSPGLQVAPQVLRQPVRAPARPLRPRFARGLRPAVPVTGVALRQDQPTVRRALQPRVVPGIVVAPQVTTPAVGLVLRQRRPPLARAPRTRIVPSAVPSAQIAPLIPPAVVLRRPYRLIPSSLRQRAITGKAATVPAGAKALVRGYRLQRAPASRVVPGIVIPAAAPVISGQVLRRGYRLQHAGASRVALGLVVAAPAAPVQPGRVLRRAYALQRAPARRIVPGIMPPVAAAPVIVGRVLRRAYRLQSPPSRRVVPGLRPSVPVAGGVLRQRPAPCPQARRGRFTLGIPAAPALGARCLRQAPARIRPCIPRRVQRGQLPFVAPVPPIRPTVLRQRWPGLPPRVRRGVVGPLSLAGVILVPFGGTASLGWPHGRWGNSGVHGCWSAGQVHGPAWQAGGPHGRYAGGSPHNPFPSLRGGYAPVYQPVYEPPGQ